jgi:predicted RNA-binding Zn-ribbon protein involved in translation (DUF1610 family)
MGQGRADNDDFEDTVTVAYTTLVCDNCGELSDESEVQSAGFDEFTVIGWVCPHCGGANLVDGHGEASADDHIADDDVSDEGGYTCNGCGEHVAPEDFDGAVCPHCGYNQLGDGHDHGFDDDDLMVQCPECGEESAIEQYYPVDRIEGGHRCPECGEIV